MSNQRYKKTFYLLGRIGRASDKELRAELCYQASSGRCESLAILSDMELIEVNNHLQRLAAEVDGADDMKLKRQQRKFFSICYDLRWTLPGGKLDYTTIFGWVNKYGYLHKDFNEYTAKELPELITQIETIQRKEYAKSKN